MKNKRKTFIMSLTLIVIIVTTVVIKIFYIAPHKNESILDNLTDEFVYTIEQHSSESVVDIKSKYGKLIGNGNGIQYFGAALVESKSVSDIDSLIYELSKKYEVVEYHAQSSSTIQNKYVDAYHKLSFSEKLDYSNSDYIIIYFFNSSHPDSDPFDLKGH